VVKIKTKKSTGEYGEDEDAQISTLVAWDRGGALYVYLYAYIYIVSFICINIYIYTYVYIYIHICIYKYTYIL
jgi:hypothetical protein